MMRSTLHRKRFFDAVHLWTSMCNEVLLMTTDNVFREELASEFRAHNGDAPELVEQKSAERIPATRGATMESVGKVNGG